MARVFLAFVPLAACVGGPTVVGVAEPGNPGLPPNAACGQLSNEDVLGVVYDGVTPKAPTALLGAELVLQPQTAWLAACADSPADAEAVAATWFDGWRVDAAVPYERFFGVPTHSGPTSVVAAVKRCGYYDGTRYGGDLAEPSLRTFAAFHWWLDHAQITGDWLLGVAPDLDGQGLQRCQVRTVYGDFGLRDEITVETQRVFLDANAFVSVDDPVTVQVVLGE